MQLNCSRRFLTCPPYYLSTKQRYTYIPLLYAEGRYFAQARRYRFYIFYYRYS